MVTAGSMGGSFVGSLTWEDSMALLKREWHFRPGNFTRFSHGLHQDHELPDECPVEPFTDMNIARWIRHFERNGSNRPEPDWHAPLKLAGKPLSKLRKSIQQFQLGDGGGPAYLIAWNRELV